MEIPTVKICFATLAILACHQSFWVTGFELSSNRSFYLDTPEKELVGGKPAKIGEFPFVAMIHQLHPNNVVVMCAGTILSVRWVLTAGHCIATGPKKFLVVFGEIDKRNVGYDFYYGPGVSMIATRGALHPRYGITINDIALLHMPRDIPLGGAIQSIRLAGIAEENVTFAGKKGIIVGWGREGPNNKGSKQLKFGQIPIIPNGDCVRSWRVDHSTICTQPKTGTDACEGDSGGPLVIRVRKSYIQIGIVSYGDAHCPSSLPGVFTRVTAFRDWIEKVTGIQY